MGQESLLQSGPFTDNTTPHSMAEAVARRSYGKLVAFLAASTHDVAAAEDALSEAFATALADWPRNGCPQKPEAWLLTVARRKHIDATRRQHSSGQVDLDLEHEQAGAILEAIPADTEIPDRRLALMFACAHPAIDAAVRAPLILQVLMGLDAAAIASAFLMSPVAMSKRLVRAKSKIREACIPFRIPEREELPARLDTVLEAIYAAFAEGWSDAAGTDAVRRDLAGEAIFLCRIITELLPAEPEGFGLLALMLYAEARRFARRNRDQEYIPLAEQDTVLWNQGMISEAEELLLRASTFNIVGRYQLEAAIQSAHVERRRKGHANWKAVLQLYDALYAVTGSPVVSINRALVVADLQGPEAALQALEQIASDKRLVEYQPWWAARAELLARTGRTAEAAHAYEIAIGLESDTSTRNFLASRQAALAI